MPGVLKKLKDMSASSGGPHHGALLYHAPWRQEANGPPGGGGGFNHHYKPINHGGRVEEEQGLIDTELLESGDVVLRVTRLAGGFVCGPQSRSLHEIKRVTGCLIKAWIDTWPSPGGGPDKDCSVFMVGGKEEAVVAGIDLITAAVDRYKELREGKREDTGLNQLVMGVTFTYYDRGVCAVKPFNESLHASSAPWTRAAAPSNGHQQHDAAADMHNGHHLYDPSSTGSRTAAPQDGVLSAAAALPLLYLTRSQVETLILVQDFWWAHCQDLVGTMNLPFSLKGAMVLCKGRLHVIFRMLERKGGNVVEVSCGTKWMGKLFLRIADICDDPFEALDPQLLSGLCNAFERTVAKDEAPPIRVEQVKKVRYWLLRLSQVAPHVEQALQAEACEDPDVTQEDLEKVHNSAVQATIKAVQLPRTPAETKYLNDIIEACMCAEAEPDPAAPEPAVQADPMASQRATFLHEQPPGSTAGVAGPLARAPGTRGALEPASPPPLAVARLQSPSPRADKPSVFARLGGAPSRVSPASNGAHASMRLSANGHAASYAPSVSPRTSHAGFVTNGRHGSNGAVGRPGLSLACDAADRRPGTGHGGIPIPGSRGEGGSTGAGAASRGHDRQTSLRATTARAMDTRTARYRSASREVDDGRRRHGSRSRSCEPSQKDRRHTRSSDRRRSRSRSRAGVQHDRRHSRSRSREGYQREQRRSRSRSRSRDRRRTRSPDRQHSRHDRQRSRSGERKHSSSQDKQHSRHGRQRSKTRDKRHSRSKDRHRSRSGERKRSRSRDRKRSRSRERHVAGAPTGAARATGLDPPPPTIVGPRHAEISPAQAWRHPGVARPGGIPTATAQDQIGRVSPPSRPQQRSPSPNASGRWPMGSAQTTSDHHQPSQDADRPYVPAESPLPSANGHKPIHTSPPPRTPNDHTDRTGASKAILEPGLGHARDDSPLPSLPPASSNGHVTYSFPVLRPSSPGGNVRDYARLRYQSASPKRRLQGGKLLRTQTALHLLYLTRGQIQTLVELQDFWWLHCQHLVDSQGFPFNPSGIMVIGQGRLWRVERLVEQLGGWAVEVAVPPGHGRRHLISLQDLCSKPLDALDRYQIAHACAEYDESVMCGDMPAVTVTQVENVQQCMLRMDQAVPYVSKLLRASADPHNYQEGLALICKEAQRGVLRALHDPMTQQEVSYVQQTIEDAITAHL